jgi:hypothetical protein
MTPCPHCGAKESHPVEDGWWCPNCKREYPTAAYKCPHPDCWEYAILCERHKSSTSTQPNQKRKLEFGIPWFLVILLVAWGLACGLLADKFISGFVSGVLPPLAIGIGFAIYALGMSYLIRKFGGDPASGVVGIVLFLSFVFVVVPICFLIARAAGLPIRW